MQSASNMVLKLVLLFPAAHEVPLRIEGLPWLCWWHAGDHCSQVGNGFCLPPACRHCTCCADQCPPLSHRTCRPWQHCDGHQVCIEGSYLLPVPYFMRSNFEDTEDASLDPEPIMVTEAEQDAALTAILDQNIGVGANGWDPKLERR